MKETRSSIILTRIAKKIRKETGDNRYRARIEDERIKLSTLIWMSCTRPIREVVSCGYVLVLNSHRFADNRARCDQLQCQCSRAVLVCSILLIPLQGLDRFYMGYSVLFGRVSMLVCVRTSAINVHLGPSTRSSLAFMDSISVRQDVFSPRSCIIISRDTRCCC